MPDRRTCALIRCMVRPLVSDNSTMPARSLKLAIQALRPLRSRSAPLWQIRTDRGRWGTSVPTVSLSSKLQTASGLREASASADSRPNSVGSTGAEQRQQDGRLLAGEERARADAHSAREDRRLHGSLNERRVLEWQTS